MTDDHFGDFGKFREVAVWSAASQIQIERWEPLVAQRIAYEFTKNDPARAQPLPSDLAWRAEMERHFLLVAAAHLITALKFASFRVQMPALLAAELGAGRDLVEHWKENMPVFNSYPRTKVPPRESGKAFAASNPHSGPYGSEEWDNQVGPKILPKVPAAELQAVVERVKKQALMDRPSLTDFFHDWEPTPWIGGSDPSNRWFPASLLVTPPKSV